MATTLPPEEQAHVVWSEPDFRPVRVVDRLECRYFSMELGSKLEDLPKRDGQVVAYILRREHRARSGVTDGVVELDGLGCGP